MEICTQLICECNGKLYKSNATMKAHRQTNLHLLWELNQKIRDLEIRSTRLENENDNLRRHNNLLLDRIKSDTKIK